MKSRFNEGDIIRFKGETELYKVVLKEITGQVFARHVLMMRGIPLFPENYLGK